MPEPVKLYVRARFLGFKRGKRMQKTHTSLLKLENVKTTKDANFYLGKRVAYIYRGLRKINGSSFRVIWGRITRPHGNSGVVRAKFRKNLPPAAMGSMLRVMLFPSRV
eukprot:CAMPEP_0197012482 /NCGR_PEP_ID=MMETSP1380-20130617/62617_1 /TAXON_ID=5936 /ORGANISM="Euplotes crassus, Strain CT5" /LENGTH=107 /DNA_ID=CAMNT_0042435979 /DNA_START=20 /DNA_END=343 /DNA_ORIENTATION=+